MIIHQNNHSKMHYKCPGPNHSPSPYQALNNSYGNSYSQGQWTKKEIFKYHLFVLHNRNKFATKSLRKSNKIFKCMTKFVKTRNSSQCRTHHQNIIKRYGDVQGAVDAFVEENPTFYQKYNQARPVLERLEENEFLSDNCKVIRMAKVEMNSEDTANPSTSLRAPNEPIDSFASLSALAISPTGTGSDLPTEYKERVLECQALFKEWLARMARLVGSSLQ